MRAEDYVTDDERVATPAERARRIKSLKFKYWGTIIAVWGFAAVFLVTACLYLHFDKSNEDVYWDTYSPPSNTEVAEQAQTIAAREGATQVDCGVYLENLESIGIKDGHYNAVWLVWFSWKGNEELDFTNNFRIYKGKIDKLEVVRDIVASDGTHYQRFRIHTTISKVFWTPRFPLESHQLRMYLEPNFSIGEVHLVQSDNDDVINPNMSIAGYEINRLEGGIEYVKYENSFDDPEIRSEEHVIKSEHMTQIEISRSGMGLYFKCFIALWATMLWVMIMLFAATRHRVDAFSFIPATLFGAAANILTGAALLPDAMEMGLMEFVNFWGILIILTAAVSIMVINRERTHWKNEEFAERFGRIILGSVIVLAIVGNIALPLSAFML